MPTLGKKTYSEDEEETDNNLDIKQKKMLKKQKKTKEEQEETTSPVLTDLNEEEKKKLLKKEKKIKQKSTPKKKAPLDLDRQCGVLITPNNIPCARSLTCKIHSMGAKRAVPGRSQPFNDLLAAYQKKGIGRPQVPASTGIANNSNTPIHNNNNVNPTTTHLQPKEDTTVIDSDEETENVLLAIERFKPIPLGQKRVYYVKRKRRYYKLRDILLEAMTPKYGTDKNAQII